MSATALSAETPDEAQCKDVNNRQRVDQVIAACTRLLNDAREQRYYAIVLRNRCGAYFKKGDFDAALADCNQALAQEPGSAIGHIRRGLAYQGKGDLDRAIADYDVAIRLDANNTYAYRERAAAYYHKDDYARAIADYTQAIQFDPNDATSLYWRGKSKKMNGDNTGGEADIAAAQRINPRVGD